MRKIVAISMPEEMYRQVSRNVDKTRYASLSEYIRELIRRDQKHLEPEQAPAPVEPIEKASSYIQVINGIEFDFTPANEVIRQAAEGRWD